MRLAERARARRAVPSTMVSGNGVTLLHDGAQCFPAMLAAIESAREEILLEMYWFHSDRTGRRFADALSAKARDGVNVFVVYDAVGSFEADSAMFGAMRDAGCEVCEYHPIAPWRQRFKIGVVNRRNHRKLLVVDGSLAMTGGVNIGDPWAAVEDGGEGWRDDMIRIHGPAALQARSVFMDTWTSLGGREPRSDDWEPSGSRSIEGDCRVSVLANHYLGQRRAIRKAYLEQIHRAESRVYITNSYFVPDRVVRRALARAVSRGVDVRVLVPGESDVLPVYYAGRRLYSWLMRRGIRLYEWQRTVLHAKSAEVDERWCTVGTFNLDYRSWRFNLEVNAAVEDREVACEMRRRFEQDLEEAAPVHERDWRYRPPSERVMERFFYLFRRLL